MKRIPLTKGKTTIVDNVDYDKVKQFKWYYDITGYAARKPRSGKVYLHRFLSGKKGYQVDHVNGDKLDNRRRNLRLCNISQNRMNKDKKCENTSGYKGVTKRGNGWVAQIGFNNKNHYLGYFKNKIDAALAYNKAALKYHSTFAKLNKIEGQ